MKAKIFQLYRDEYSKEFDHDMEVRRDMRAVEQEIQEWLDDSFDSEGISIAPAIEVVATDRFIMFLVE